MGKLRSNHVGYDCHFLKILFAIFFLMFSLQLLSANVFADEMDEISIFQEKNRVNQRLQSPLIGRLTIKKEPYISNVTANGVSKEKLQLSTKTTRINVVIKNFMVFNRSRNLLVFPPKYIKVLLVNADGKPLGTSKGSGQLKSSGLIYKSYKYSFSDDDIVQIGNLKLTEKILQKVLYIAVAVYNNNNQVICIQALAKFDPNSPPLVLHPKVDELDVDSLNITGTKDHVNSWISNSLNENVYKEKTPRFTLPLYNGALNGQDFVTVKEHDVNTGSLGYANVRVVNPYSLIAGQPNIIRGDEEIQQLINTLNKPPNENAKPVVLNNYYKNTLGKIGTWADLKIYRTNKPWSQAGFVWDTDMTSTELAMNLKTVLNGRKLFSINLYGVHGDYGYETPSTTVTFMASDPPHWNPTAESAFDFGTVSLSAFPKVIAPKTSPQMQVIHAAGDQSWGVTISAGEQLPANQGIELFYRDRDGRKSLNHSVRLQPPAIPSTETSTTFGTDWYQAHDAQRDTGIFMDLEPDVHVGPHKLAIQWTITDAPG